MSNEQVKLVKNLRDATKDEIFEADKSFNANVWAERLNRLDAPTTLWYIALAKENPGQTYDEYYCEYDIKEGIRLFAQVSYHSCIHNGGFARIILHRDLKCQGMTTVERRLFPAPVEGGGFFYLKNCKESRKWMAMVSKSVGYIFSNGF